MGLDMYLEARRFVSGYSHSKDEEKELFKTITEENNNTVTDDLKKEFQSYVDGLSDEDFASASIQGHMRAFISSA